MTASIPTQSDYNNQSSSTAYALNIDASIAAFMRSGAAFAPHQRATATSAVEIDPGAIWNPQTLSLVQVGGISFGNTHASTTLDTIQSVTGFATGQAIRDNRGVIPANATLTLGATAPYAGSVTLSAAAGSTVTGLEIVASQIVSGFTAPASNPRIDRVVINAATGAATLVAGTEAATPSPPAIPVGTLPCAQIYFTVAGGATVTGAMITDERTAWNGAAPGVPYAAAAGTVNAITATFAPATSNPPYVGELLLVKAAGANTITNPTFAPDGNTAYQITKLGGTALAAGDIAGAGHELALCYRGSFWELLNPAPNLSANLDTIGSAQGDILFRGASGWTVLAPGAAGQNLVTNGASANPAWATQESGVTSFNSRTGAVTLESSDLASVWPNTLYATDTYSTAYFSGTFADNPWVAGTSYSGSSLGFGTGTWKCMGSGLTASIGSSKSYTNYYVGNFLRIS